MCQFNQGRCDVGVICLSHGVVIGKDHQRGADGQVLAEDMAAATVRAVQLPVVSQHAVNGLHHGNRRAAIQCRLSHEKLCGSNMSRHAYSAARGLCASRDHVAVRHRSRRADDRPGGTSGCRDHRG